MKLGWRWIIGVLLFASTVINYIDRQTLSVLGPHLKTEFHWSNQDFALIVIAFRVAYAVMQTVSGRFVDRLGTRNGLTLAVVWYSCAAILTSLASGLASFCGFRFLLGAGEAANWPAATKAVGEWFPRRERGLAVALFDSGSSIGAAVAPALVLFLIGHFGDWRSAFVLTGCLGFLWLIAWRRYYHPPETHPYVSEAERRMILDDHAAEEATEAAPEEGRAAPELRGAPVPAPDLGQHREPRPDRSRLVHDRRLVRHLSLDQGLRSRADRGRVLGSLPGRRPRQLRGRRLVRRAHRPGVVGGSRATARHRGRRSRRPRPHPGGVQLLVGPARGLLCRGHLLLRGADHERERPARGSLPGPGGRDGGRLVWNGRPASAPSARRS